VNQLLEVGDKNQGTRKYAALNKWASQLKSIHSAVQNKMY
jgi:COP9 signalosome complex subunit 2